MKAKNMKTNYDFSSVFGYLKIGRLSERIPVIRRIFNSGEVSSLGYARSIVRRRRDFFRRARQGGAFAPSDASAGGPDGVL